MLPGSGLALGMVAAMANVVPAQQRVIVGSVVDSSGAPVPYVNVIAAGSQRRIAAGPDGTFRLPLDSSAKREIEFRRIGYHPLTLKLDSWPDSAIRVVMAMATRTLSAITVAVERSQSLAIRGFYERMNDVGRGINHGFFITPEEIAQRSGARVTDFMGGHPALRVRLVTTGLFGGGRKGWQIQGLDGCAMQIYIDGVRFYNLSDGTSLDDNHIFINDLVSSTTIAGIEVYPRSVTAPPKYQSLNGRCGVILIWTK